jgi:hypothetical protein
MTVARICRTAPRSPLTRAERREWMKMAFYSQLVALGLGVRLLTYDLIVLQKREP